MTSDKWWSVDEIRKLTELLLHKMKCPLNLWVLCMVYKQGVQTFRFKTMNSAMIFGLLTLGLLYSVSGEKTTEEIEVRHMTDTSSEKKVNVSFGMLYLTGSVSVRLSAKSREHIRSIYISEVMSNLEQHEHKWICHTFMVS